MTTKEKVIKVINSLSDDATLDDVIDRLYLLRKLELGMAQAELGDVMEHHEFMDELEREDASWNLLDTPSARRPTRNPGIYRARCPRDCFRIRASDTGIRRVASYLPPIGAARP